LNVFRLRLEPTGSDGILGITQRGRVNRTLVTLFTFLPRLRFQRAIALKLKILERTLTKVQLEKTMAEKSGRHTMICLSNATLYLLLFNLDLTVLLHQLALEQNELKRKVFSKHIISLLYEFFEDFPQVFGDKVRRVLTSLPSAEKHERILTEICKGVRDYRKRHKKEFHEIRNIVGAHMDLDGELQLKTLAAIKHEDIQQLASDLDVWFSKVMDFLASVLNDYGLSPQLVREIADNAAND
jgi:hypothetical protein